MIQPKRDTTMPSPIRLVLILLLAIFTVEFGLMAFLLGRSNEAVTHWAVAAIDSSVLPQSALHDRRAGAAGCREGWSGALSRGCDGTGCIVQQRRSGVTTGEKLEVGAWAMQQAVTQYAAWQAAGLQPPAIAVNVSAVQLKRRDFVASVQYAIAIAGKPDHGLDLEITESMIMEDIEACIEKLKAVRDLGVGIFIDDFGTGHSSLRYLTHLPITALKIDRAFIQHMTANADDVAIVSTIITLGHNLNLKVIAEGVETQEQSTFLRLLKCDEYQGYLFSKPVPAEQVPALLKRP